MTGTAAEALREALAFGAFIFIFPLALAAVFGGLCWVVCKIKTKIN